MEKKAMSVAMALVAFVLAAGTGLSDGAVHTVGDSKGWTIMGTPNYTEWALSKKFMVGDVILFEYNKQFHNVLQVSKAHYSSCNVSSPIAKYATGNDSIPIKTKGQHFFICGIPGHCDAGQKVDIKVAEASSEAPSMSPNLSPSAAPGAPTPATGGGSAPATGSSSPTASSPKPNAGSRSISGMLLAGVLAALSFSAGSAGLVRQ